MRVLIALFVLIAGLLTGCSTTVYESLPVGSMTRCDSGWPGLWNVTGRGANAASATPEANTVIITTDCRMLDKDGSSKPLNVSLLTTRDGQYLVVSNDRGTPDCVGANYTHCGYQLLRFERDGDVMRVYFPDNARVSKAIADGVVKGYQGPVPRQQDPNSEPTYRNFIAGNSREVARILREHPEFFLTEPQFVLKRAPADMPATSLVPPAPSTSTLAPTVPATTATPTQGNDHHP